MAGRKGHAPIPQKVVPIERKADYGVPVTTNNSFKPVSPAPVPKHNRGAGGFVSGNLRPSTKEGTARVGGGMKQLTKLEKKAGRRGK